jgi:Tol biopolymer transport system component
MLGGCGDVHFSISKNGSLVYIEGRRPEPERILVWVDRSGNAQPITDLRRRFFGPRLSPDGKRLSVWIAGDSPHVWIYEIARGTLNPLTTEGQNFWSVWTPDGKSVAFASRRSGIDTKVFLKPADGSRPAEQLTTGDYRHQPLCWSPDGKMLVFHQNYHPATGWDVLVLQVEGEPRQWPLLNTSSDEYQPALSPDGRWLAYVSNESDRNDIYVTTFPTASAKWPISTGGGIQPVWAPSGKELFYRNGNEMMVVGIATSPTFTPTNPTLLFKGNYHQGAIYGRNYDIAPDGRRFVMLKELDPESVPQNINIILNWFEELKRLVPTGN